MQVTIELLREVMRLAWQFVKTNNWDMSKALKLAWANIKLRDKMQRGVVLFSFQKVNGEIRIARGTLKMDLLPLPQSNTRKQSELIQVYYDMEKRQYRSFKKMNLVC